MLDQSLTLQGEEPANNNRICSTRHTGREKKENVKNALQADGRKSSGGGGLVMMLRQVVVVVVVVEMIGVFVGRKSA